MTNENGAEIGRWTYFPFGMEAAVEESGEQRMKFTGHERDGEVKLDYMLARYFGSSLGRFVSVDPLTDSARPGSFQSWNRYSYAKSSPLNRIDPDGLTDIEITINRQRETANSTTGTYWVNGRSVSGSTLELPDRQNQTNISRIPAGDYPARRSTFSDRRDVIRIDNVPNRTGIAIHAGNTPSDTTGCILVGESSGTDRVNQSRAAMSELLGYVDIVAALDSMLGETTSISVSISDPPGPLEMTSQSGLGIPGLEAGDFRDPLAAIFSMNDNQLEKVIE